jgi:hypothetical protein
MLFSLMVNQMEILSLLEACGRGILCLPISSFSVLKYWAPCYTMWRWLEISRVFQLPGVVLE